MTSAALQPHQRPAYRRLTLRHAAGLARDMLDYADEIGHDVDRAELERIERRALAELARDADSINQTATDARTLPPEYRKRALFTDTTPRAVFDGVITAGSFPDDPANAAFVAECWQLAVAAISELIESTPTPAA